MTEACACCGRPLPPKGPNWDFKTRTFTTPAGSVRFSPRKAIYIDALYRARNRGGFANVAELMDAVYADDIGGGPDHATTASVHLQQIRRRLEPVGWTISKNMGRPRINYQLMQIERVEA
jgi:hypothetical protein